MRATQLHVSSFHYFPFPLVWVVALAAIVGALIVLLEIRVLGYAFETMGIERRNVLSVLVLCLLGSYVNIPIASLPPEPIVSDPVVRYFGVPYVVPRVEVGSSTVLAVNVGGAVIPTLLSLFLLHRHRLWGRGAVAAAVVGAIVHTLAHPVPGVGIAVPSFAPALAACAVALVLSRQSAAPLAYVAGTLGTLVGADLLNIGKIAGLGAPVASIGGAGTFDGVFVTGILAVLLAGFPPGPPPREQREAQQPGPRPR